MLVGWLASRATLLRVCVRWTHGNLQEAEDLLGDACVRVIEAQRLGVRVLDPVSFSSRVIANLARDRFRSASARAAKRPDLRALADAAVSATPDDQLCTRQHLSLAQHALATGPRRQRVALLLRAQGDDYAAIARTIGTTEANARRLVRVARRRVQQIGVQLNGSP